MKIEMAFAPCALAVLAIVLSFSPFFVGFGSFEFFKFCAEFVGVYVGGFVGGYMIIGERVAAA